MFAPDAQQAYRDRLLAGYPQGARARFIRPAEIAELIWFLTQPAAAPITGANISADFGLSAGIVPTSLKYATHFKRNSEAGMVMVNMASVMSQT